VKQTKLRGRKSHSETFGHPTCTSVKLDVLRFSNSLFLLAQLFSFNYDEEIEISRTAEFRWSFFVTTVGLALQLADGNNVQLLYSSFRCHSGRSDIHQLSTNDAGSIQVCKQEEVQR
jgi:hypothetical protein